MGEYDHWKLQKAIEQILQDTVPYHSLQPHWAQVLRARIFDARNPEQSINEGKNDSVDKPVDKDQEVSLEGLQEKIEKAAEKANRTIKDLHCGLDKRNAPEDKTGSKQTKRAARNSLRYDHISKRFIHDR